MHEMEHIKEIRTSMERSLADCVMNGVDGIGASDAGAASDIIKDMAMAEYYLTAVDAMHKPMDVDGAIANIRSMWDAADPDHRKRMKADMTKLVSEMVV